MPWPLLMLFQNTLASVFTLQSRELAKKYQKAHFQILTIVFSVLYAVFLGYALLHWKSIIPSEAFNQTPLIVLVGLSFTCSTVLSFIIFRYVDAAIGSIFSVLNLVSVVLISTLTLHEGLTRTQLIGASLLVIAIVSILTIHLSSAKKHRWQLGLILAIITSVFFGFAIAGQKYLLGKVNLPTYAIFGIGAEFIPLLVLSLLYNRREYRHLKNRRFSQHTLLMGLVRGGAGLLFIIALVDSNNASVIGMLSGFKIVLTAILAAIFLKETTYMDRKLFAALIAMLGIGLMLW